MNETKDIGNMRKTALCLYSMHRADRDWVLEHLPFEQQKRLQAMLDELKTIGVPNEPALFPMLELNKRKPVSDPGHSETINFIDNASWQRVSAVLDGEPYSVYAFIVGCRQWAWQPALLTSLKPRERERLLKEAKRVKSKVTSRFANTLLEEFQKRLLLNQAGRTNGHDGHNGKNGHRWFHMRNGWNFKWLR